MMDVRANPKAFMVVGVNVIHPNGTARPMMGGHTRDFFSVIPNGTISGEIATSQFNPPEASYCSGSIIPGFVAILGYTPMVAGTYTVMPYVQYFFGANGYGEQDAINAMGPCLDAPMTGTPGICSYNTYSPTIL